MNTHMLKKIENLREQNFKGTVAQLTVMGNELTSGQKEKPQGKKKNLTAKGKTSGQKEKPHGKKKMTHGKKNNLTAKEKRIKKCPRHQRTFSFCS